MKIELFVKNIYFNSSFAKNYLKSNFWSLVSKANFFLTSAISFGLVSLYSEITSMSI